MTSPPGARPSLVPHLLLLAMLAIWGCSYSGVKIALLRLAPYAVVGSRFWIAVLCLLPFVLRARGGPGLRGTWKPGLVTGLALLCGYLLQTLGMRETTASLGGFLSGLIVLLVAIGGCVFLGDRMRAGSLLGLLLGIGGTVLLCWRSGPDDGTNTLRGILLQIGSMCSYAGHVLLISRLSPKGGEMAYSFWQLVVVALGATIALALDGNVAAPAQVVPHLPAFLLPQPDGSLILDGVLFGAVAYLGFFATALGIGVQSLVQPKIRPSHVALLFATQPLFAALAGYLVMGDAMGWQQFAGGALIVAGVLTVTLVK